MHQLPGGENSAFTHKHQQFWRQWDNRVKPRNRPRKIDVMTPLESQVLRRLHWCLDLIFRLLDSSVGVGNIQTFVWLTKNLI